MTIKDIARLAQVSVSTVSKVLNNKDENITEETRKRVLDVARQYQFTPYKNIRDQLSVSSHTIALIVPDVASPFFSGLITAIEQEVRALGYAVKYANFSASLSVTRSSSIASAGYKSMLDLHFSTIL